VISISALFAALVVMLKYDQQMDESCRMRWDKLNKLLPLSIVDLPVSKKDIMEIVNITSWICTKCEFFMRVSKMEYGYTSFHVFLPHPNPKKGKYIGASYVYLFESMFFGIYAVIDKYNVEKNDLFLSYEDSNFNTRVIFPPPYKIPSLGSIRSVDYERRFKGQLALAFIFTRDMKYLKCLEDRKERGHTFMEFMKNETISDEYIKYKDQGGMCFY
jgi:hypothetical protein